jgi:hypothetical protein
VSVDPEALQLFEIGAAQLTPCRWSGCDRVSYLPGPGWAGASWWCHSHSAQAAPTTATRDEGNGGAWYQPERHHRATDPSTSRDSARAAEATATSHRLTVLAALRERGPGTQSEVADRCGLLPHQVNKRLADLHAGAAIEPTGEHRCGHAGRAERVWRAL